jgi:hypothetical protein
LGVIRPPKRAAQGTARVGAMRAVGLWLSSDFVNTTVYLHNQGQSMNYQKLDAALAMAVNQITDPQEANLVVFIHIQHPLNESTITSLSAANAFLQRLGISNIKENINVLTATVSLDTLSELSQQTWVQHIKLSQKLHLVRKI